MKKRLGLFLLTGLLSVCPPGLRGQDAASNTGTDAKAQAEEPSGVATNDASEEGHRIARGPIVRIGKNATLRTNETAEAVVVVGASAKVQGKVRDALVDIGGDIELDGEVDDAVVCVLGNIKLGPHAIVHHDVVSVGGHITAADGAVIEGRTQEVDFENTVGLNLGWLRDWFVHCFLLMRPLSLQVGFVWVIAGIVFLFYLLIAALFPYPVHVCREELSRRPATTFLVGLLAKFLAPLLIVVLAITGIGLVVAPFVWAALFLGAIVGKIALAEWIGLRLVSGASGPAWKKPLVGFVLGTAVILVLYTIPVVGFLTFLLMSVWGLGCAATAAFIGLRRETPPTPAAPPTYAFPPAPAPAPMPFVPPTAPVVPVMPIQPATAPAASNPAPASPSIASAAPMRSEPASTASAETAVPFALPPENPPRPGVPPAIPETAMYPRAGFWQRVAAGLLDLILIALSLGFSGILPRSGLFTAVLSLAYFVGLWSWRGTTIGGIVLGLKVVRVDDQPLSPMVCLVRALGAVLSMCVLFLGFFWIAWDGEKQGWHDRIAGTYVLKLPRGTPLL